MEFFEPRTARVGGELRSQRLPESSLPRGSAPPSLLPVETGACQDSEFALRKFFEIGFQQRRIIRRAYLLPKRKFDGLLASIALRLDAGELGSPWPMRARARGAKWPSGCCSR